MTRQPVVDSVRDRLFNIARDKHVPFQQMLIRYGIERLLYRLQQSSYSDQFILKGAMLFLDWTEQLHRPTRDADFLTFGSPDRGRLEDIFRDILETNIEDDGLDFKPDTVSAQQIREDGVYEGVRIKFQAKLGDAKIPMRVDLGFGDAVEPPPEQVDMPPLLDFDAPTLRGYTPYTAIAEKYEAMVTLGEINSRMKDYHDIWILSRRFEFDGEQLQSSIESTCRQRSTALPETPPDALKDSFAAIPNKTSQWNSFIQNLRSENSSPNLDEVVSRLNEFLWPPTEALTQDKNFNQIWTPGGPWT